MSAGFSPASLAMVSNVSPRKPSRASTRLAASRMRAAVGARSGVGSLNGSSYLVSAITPSGPSPAARRAGLIPMRTLSDSGGSRQPRTARPALTPRSRLLVYPTISYVTN